MRWNNSSQLSLMLQQTISVTLITSAIVGAAAVTLITSAIVGAAAVATLDTVASLPLLPPPFATLKRYPLQP